jgi:hypothetical protein
MDRSLLASSGLSCLAEISRQTVNTVNFAVEMDGILRVPVQPSG